MRGKTLRRSRPGKPGAERSGSPHKVNLMMGRWCDSFHSERRGFVAVAISAPHQLLSESYRLYMDQQGAGLVLVQVELAQLQEENRTTTAVLLLFYYIVDHFLMNC